MKFDFAKLIEDLRPKTITKCGCGRELIGCTLCDVCVDASESTWRESETQAAMASLPEKYWYADFAASDPSVWKIDPKHVAKAKAAIPCDWVVLKGFAGSGKTSLAVAMLRATILKGRERNASSHALWLASWARYVSAFELGKARSQASLGKGEAPIVETALSCSVLVLDDLGEEQSMHNSAIPEVIYERHARRRRTIITTGRSDAMIASRYGDGIARRVFENARLIEVGEQPV